MAARFSSTKPATFPPACKSSCCRVLEQHEVTPVGETQPRTSAFRVVAATNRDLRGEIRRGDFREDLYFRLAVFEIALPPLRERVEDIPLLAERFLAGAASRRHGALRLRPRCTNCAAALGQEMFANCAMPSNTP